MQEQDRIEAPRRPRIGRGVAYGVLLFLIWEYGISVWRLAHGSAEMDNKFSKLARTEYFSFLLGQNLMVLTAYVILFAAAYLLIFPVVSWWTGHSRRKGTLAIALRALLLVAVTHGYFLFRLVHRRPYFLAEGEYNAWYYRILDLPPSGWKHALDGALFTVLPWLVLAAVVTWWFVRIGVRGRVALVLLGIAGAVVAIRTTGSPGHPVAAVVPDGKRPLNIIVIGSDSLRGDRLGFSGYRPTRTDGAAAAGVSPHIDEWAKDTVRFERCYTPIASTLESAVTVMSSSFPHTHGIRQMYPARDQVEATEASITPIAQVLEERGYDTAAIGDWCAGYYQMMPLGFKDISVSNFDNFRVYMSQAVVMAHFVVPLYFDNSLGYRIFPQIGSFAQFVTPEVVTRRVEDKLAQQAKTGRPFFWHVFYSCNHLPYRSADPYYRMFTDPTYKGPNQTGVDFDINSFVGHTDLEDKLKALSEPQIQQIRGLYDGCTRQFDECFARIQQALVKNGLDKDTIVVVTADHGDDLYEPGVTITHGLGFNGGDHCFHIPMAIHAPGIPPKSIPEQIRSIDLSPTLLDLVGVDRPVAWEGRSVAGWMRGEETPEDLPYYGETSFPFIQFKVTGVERPFLPAMDELTTIDPAYNHQFVLQPEWLEPLIAAKQRCMRTRKWKIVCTPARDGSRHFGLFHLAEDPDCRRDLAGERPEVLAPMKTAIERWIDGHEETPVREIFPGGEP